MSIGEHITGPIGYIIAQNQKRDMTDTMLKAVFLSLQLIDLILTMLAMRYGWLELNPFMKTSQGSIYKLAIFKFAVPLFISWFVPGRLLIPAILLLGGVLGWNIKELALLVF